MHIRSMSHFTMKRRMVNSKTRCSNAARSFALFTFLVLFPAARLFCQQYPVIPELKSQDIVFSQYQDEVSAANKALSAQKPVSFNLYVYKAKKDDTVFSVAARCSIPYDTFATANGISESHADLAGKTLILPTVAGLFIPLDPLNSVEILLAKEHSHELLNGGYPIYPVNGRKYYFMQDEKFSPTERAFFLDASFRLPLEHSVLTSSFGMRISPISGTWKMHKGIDMAAPVGTKVYACKAGTVSFIGNMDPTFGNYIIIRHDGGMTSVYAHLSQVLVQKGDIVPSGYLIGKVGITGATTGPHLHFEIRMNGSALDPQKYLPE